MLTLAELHMQYSVETVRDCISVLCFLSVRQLKIELNERETNRYAASLSIKGRIY